MLQSRGQSLAGRRCLVSGSGNVAQFTVEKIIAMGGTVLTLSDSSGYIFDEEGIDEEKLAFVKILKNVRRGRIEEYADAYPQAVYTPTNPDTANPLWQHKAEVAFPCATQNEIDTEDARHLVDGGIQMVVEGANMPTVPDGIALFVDSGLLFAPGKAANAGGVAVSGLEMAQNSMRLQWPMVEVEDRLRMIMKNIHASCLGAAAQYGTPGNYVAGANIAGFIKVVDAMLDQGLV